jgi:hypothetical protein
MMDEDKLFTLALGLVPPWLVDHVTFTVEEKRLDLHINFSKGSRLACPECESRARGYRTHKNFINMAYLVLGKLDLKLPT